MEAAAFRYTFNLQFATLVKKHGLSNDVLSFFSACPVLFAALKTREISRLKEIIETRSPPGGLTALQTAEQALTCSCLHNHNSTSCAHGTKICYSSPNDWKNKGEKD